MKWLKKPCRYLPTRIFQYIFNTNKYEEELKWNACVRSPRGCPNTLQVPVPYPYVIFILNQIIAKILQAK